MKKTVKKLTAAVLLSATVLSVVGCGNGDAKGTDAMTGDTTQAVETAPETTPETEVPAITSITLLTPTDGQKDIVLASAPIIKHMNSRFRQLKDANFGYAKEELCTPPAVTFTWSDEDAAEGKEYRLMLSENEDMSDAMRFKATTTSLDVYNLKVGTKYYWNISSNEGTTKTFSFKTESGYPRFIKADNISNMRDLGGYKTLDGMYIKQGIVYRSAQLEDANEYGRNVVLKDLGIKTDLDLRGAAGGSAIPGLTKISIPLKWYQHIFDEANKADVKRTMLAFADENNYPILFHCSLGRDRTGTTAFLLLALCGVDEETIVRDYYTSFYSLQGNFSAQELAGAVQNIAWLTEGLNNFGTEEDTLQIKVKNYLLSTGLTEQDLAKIRDILVTA